MKKRAERGRQDGLFAHRHKPATDFDRVDAVVRACVGEMGAADHFRAGGHASNKKIATRP
jgi:hypothetical protein